MSLYGTLTKKHGISGLRVFSRTAFAQQLALPGMIALRADHQGTIIAANLFYVQGDAAYDHLTASSPEGYERRASYALKWWAIQHFTGKVRWIDWGGGAGAASNPDDGLTVFKSGWTRNTRAVYFCGRILNSAQYREIVKARELEQSPYFPAYRDGEFVPSAPAGGGAA